ncbi:hypothetical protein AMTRI_Chr01g134060 [Amborella trichopoda]|uniref:Cytochrome b561 and DOMON domain-containing protein n=1 Tax=Amborella trichopoda TaxID=13333 RepID=W1Q076_AMBTC|nr:cytochrome b561 and DOMON domain-containing protein At3g61750 [Amborella trichopoda]XP_020527779.1 cytochrome b561 and DOMON domain-containing protein At3g61750 [Amborella trichopoda]ERN14123.1 hypothetical protein AMTR_s00021p00244700 [Amborella trichopoda]|eukprot:XP_006852656.1 cytochrome b561 and DOMON domain-containing protein At3g61750 [Amborella trichopoda]
MEVRVLRRSTMLLVLGLVLVLRGSIGFAQTDNCNGDLGALSLPFNASGLVCSAVWNTFLLRYSQSQDNVLSIVLSAEYTNGWVSIGFSKDGRMVGSSAMVGWIRKGGKAAIKQYYLGGQDPSEVVVNQGELTLSDITPSVLLRGATIYLAFQLKLTSPIKKRALIFALGSRNPVHEKLTMHEDETTVAFDFSMGTSSVSSSYPSQLKRNHGLLGIFGWGMILPIGAIIARYCKQWDPLWFYLHSILQLVGFVLALAGLVAGVALYNQLNANVVVHRGLGIFVFVLGILQVMAFFIRPQKEAKVRKYWNWYHHWSGRFALFFGAVNILLGIQVGGGEKSWKVGYGINSAFILITVIILELMKCLKGSTKPDPSPAFQMHSTHG